MCSFKECYALNFNMKLLRGHTCEYMWLCLVMGVHSIGIDDPQWMVITYLVTVSKLICLRQERKELLLKFHYAKYKTFSYSWKKKNIFLTWIMTSDKNIKKGRKEKRNKTRNTALFESDNRADILTRAVSHSGCLTCSFLFIFTYDLLSSSHQMSHDVNKT